MKEKPNTQSPAMVMVPDLDHQAQVTEAHLPHLKLMDNPNKTRPLTPKLPAPNTVNLSNLLILKPQALNMADLHPFLKPLALNTADPNNLLQPHPILHPQPPNMEPLKETKEDLANRLPTLKTPSLLLSLLPHLTVLHEVEAVPRVATVLLPLFQEEMEVTEETTPQPHHQTMELQPQYPTTMLQPPHPTMELQVVTLDSVAGLTKTLEDRPNKVGMEKNRFGPH